MPLLPQTEAQAVARGAREQVKHEDWTATSISPFLIIIAFPSLGFTLSAYVYFPAPVIMKAVAAQQCLSLPRLLGSRYRGSRLGLRNCLPDRLTVPSHNSESRDRGNRRVCVQTKRRMRGRKRRALQEVLVGSRRGEGEGERRRQEEGRRDETREAGEGIVSRKKGRRERNSSSSSSLQQSPVVERRKTRSRAAGALLLLQTKTSSLATEARASTIAPLSLLRCSLCESSEEELFLLRFVSRHTTADERRCWMREECVRSWREGLE